MTEAKISQPIAYAARHKDMHEVETSCSDVLAFIAISDWILNKVVWCMGLGIQILFQVVHKRVVTKEERKEFKAANMYRVI